ncbi:MAG: Ig-like domain-containing protein [bacterium]|nr:Ig-like domain-containing protein [bacterium]
MSRYFRIICMLLLSFFLSIPLTQTQAAGVVSNCTYTDFATALTGGGVVDFATGGNCTISISSRITISQNTTIQNTSGFVVTFTTPKGGSPLFYVDGGITFNASNVTFYQGGGFAIPSGTYNGGAIFNFGGIVNLTNTRFDDNFGGSGGAIYNNAGTITINNAVFVNNSAISSGGSILNDGGTITIDNTLFSSNSAGTGSGIRNENSGTATIRNSTFSGNTPGGAVYNFFGTITITHSTFSGNSSFLNPANIDNAGGTTTVTASIFNGGDCGGTLTDGGNNIAFNAAGCLGANVNPQLGALSGVVHIPANRAIEYAPACVLGTDQLGTARPQGSLCTPGAVEADPPPQSVTVQFSSASGSTPENTNTGAFIRVTTSDTQPVGSNANVTLSVTGGSASGADFSFLGGTINIPAGTAHNATISIDPNITIVNDAIDENNETIDLSLSAPSGASLGVQSTYIHTILDDDITSVFIGNPFFTISEPNTSNSFNVRLNSQPLAVVTVNILSTDITECLPDVSSISFDDTNWMNPQTVLVTAQDDLLLDSSQLCDISLTFTTTDPTYSLFFPQTVNVTVSDNDIPNAILIIGGDNQQTPINTAFTTALTVQVNDAGGQPIEGATVTFTPPASGASAGLSQTSVLTDVNGQATITATANGEVGAYQILVESGILTPVNFNLENLDPDVLDVTAVCVGDNLVITINAGAPNFDITAISGADMPLLNQPLGAYTFFGPDTWVGVTITELTGDLEFITLPDITCDATVITPPVVQAPPPPVPDRCDIRGYSLEMPVGIFCTDLYENGQFTIAGSVPANLAPVIDAVDVGKFNGERTVSGEFGTGLPICLMGQGRLFFLDASTSPRAQFELTTFSVDGKTCGFIINSGTVVLIAP